LGAEDTTVSNLLKLKKEENVNKKRSWRGTKGEKNGEKSKND